MASLGVEGSSILSPGKRKNRTARRLYALNGFPVLLLFVFSAMIAHSLSIALLLFAGMTTIVAVGRAIVFRDGLNRSRYRAIGVRSLAFKRCAMICIALIGVVYGVFAGKLGSAAYLGWIPRDVFSFSHQIDNASYSIAGMPVRADAVSATFVIFSLLVSMLLADMISYPLIGLRKYSSAKFLLVNRERAFQARQAARRPGRARPAPLPTAGDVYLGLFYMLVVVSLISHTTDYDGKFRPILTHLGDVTAQSANIVLWIINIVIIYALLIAVLHTVSLRRAARLRSTRYPPAR